MEPTKLTGKEVNTLLKVMKEPKFHELMGEYIDEISDPKNKLEYEQYLRQLESQKDLPPNTKLVCPTPAFCIKTISKRHSTTKKNELIEQKLYINVCSNENIPNINESKQNKDGSDGIYYSCPYMLSKGRPSKSKKGELCMVYDILFHPKATELSRNPQFQKFLCDTSIEAVSKYMKTYHEEASNDYKLLTKYKCKGETPGLITIKCAGDPNSLVENLKLSSHETTSQKEINKEKKQMPDQIPPDIEKDERTSTRKRQPKLLK